jgi:hypothetical protein
MVFKKKFFLDLSGEGDQQASPAVVAPVKLTPPPAAAANSSTAKAAPATVAAAAPAAAAPAAGAPAASEATRRTTAEEIAAELAAAQANRPAPSQATFAPDCLSPAGALPRRRRRPAADLAGFRAIAAGLLGS